MIIVCVVVFSGVQCFIRAHVAISILRLSSPDRIGGEGNFTPLLPPAVGGAKQDRGIEVIHVEQVNTSFPGFSLTCPSGASRRKTWDRGWTSN